MLEWWSSMGLLGQILACMAIPATIVLVVQTVMVLITGFDGGAEMETNLDIDTDIGSGSEVITGDEIDDIVAFDQAGLQIFSIRGVVTFFAIFGWAGMWLLSIDINQALALIISFALGTAAMIGTAYAMRFLMRLQAKGNQNINDALGVSGTVYINIPKQRGGHGKVTALVSGRYSEFDAVTDDEEAILTGNSVTVLSICSPNILVVTKK